jgi:hypothetical protein
MCHNEHEEEPTVIDPDRIRVMCADKGDISVTSRAKLKSTDEMD